MKLAFLSLLSRNGIVDFIRNNKSQHIKISYYKVRRRDRRLSSARSKWDWVGRGGFPAPSTSYISHSTDYSSRHNNKVNIIIGDSVGCYNNRKVVLNFGIIITSIGYNSDLTNSLPIWSLDPRWAQHREGGIGYHGVQELYIHRIVWTNHMKNTFFKPGCWNWNLGW